MQHRKKSSIFVDTVLASTESSIIMAADLKTAKSYALL